MRPEKVESRESSRVPFERVVQLAEGREKVARKLWWRRAEKNSKGRKRVEKER